jgi:hypothetical protein
LLFLVAVVVAAPVQAADARILAALPLRNASCMGCHLAVRVR